MHRLRNWLLSLIFNALYNRLVLFHELIGRAVFGRAWAGRRLYCLADLGDRTRILDLGAGEGSLAGISARRCLTLRAFDPSPAMRARAFDQEALVQSGWSFALPVASGSIDRIVATYPGSWILDDETWTEIERVLVPSGEVRIFVGGTYESGRGSRLRNLVLRLAYGSTRPETFGIAAATNRSFAIETNIVPDTWGAAYIVEARRSDC